MELVHLYGILLSEQIFLINLNRYAIKSSTAIIKGISLINSLLMKILLITTLTIFITFIFVNCQTISQANIYLRTNQVGFLPNDMKTAVILSKDSLPSKQFFIRDSNSNKVQLEGNISNNYFNYGSFKFCYEIDFSRLTKEGRYFIESNNTKSYPFAIGDSIYNPVRDSLSLFFKVQRCGPTNPLLHRPCHLLDAAKLVGYSDSTGVDLTGGWHDAGDYIKFLKTTAFTTYMLLFSYEFDKHKFNYDLNKNDVPDILEEARVGLDWLLRCNFEKYFLVSQVQDEKDHQVGFRLPENDSLQFLRPGFVSIGKNTVGLYAAALAIASRIWQDKFYDDEFSNRCLISAENIYSIRNNVQDIDSTFSNHYVDHDFNGELALGSVELYIATKKESYLTEAYNYADKAKSDFWWSVGDINSLAHYKISQFDSSYSKYIYRNLNSFNSNIKNSLFREGMEYSWGSTNSFLGISLQGILYKKISGSKEFDSLNIFQRDLVLGKNPWGLSFIYNIGTQFPKNLHSQTAFFNGGYLPGALTAGPAPLSILKNYNINRKNFEFDEFNSDSLKYYDDVMDYITNEPTIIGNATALFVFGCLSN